MELALVASALFGVGAAYARNQGESHPSTAIASTPSVQYVKDPEASNLGPGTLYASAAQPAPYVMPTPQQQLGASGRRDNSLFLDDSSLNERQNRFYNAPNGTKREVPRSAFQEPTPQDNILVRSQTGWEDRYRATVDRPNRMHGVNPVATTSGTASELVGPGVAVGAAAATGTDGLHYGTVRMMPNDVHNHFREQRGGVVPGKHAIDAPTSSAALNPKQHDRVTIGETGFERGDAASPLKYYDISEDYLTSAPGRAVATGNPGWGGRRLEPAPEHTNRGTELDRPGPRGIGHSGLEAVDLRGGWGNRRIDTDRGHANNYVGPAGGKTIGGHLITAGGYHVPPTERNTTEPNKGAQWLNAAAPYQQNYMPTTQEAQMTQGLGALPIVNAAPQFAPGPADHTTNVRDTARALTEFRPGVAAGQMAGGHGCERKAFDVMEQLTQRGMGNEYLGPKGISQNGLSAPMSYEAMLKSEGYSVRDVPQEGFIPGAGAFNSVHIGQEAIGAVDLPAPRDQANQTGGVGNQGASNFYVPVQHVEADPNRDAVWNDRLDPRILDALARNELALVQSRV